MVQSAQDRRRKERSRRSRPASVRRPHIRTSRQTRSRNVEGAADHDPTELLTVAQFAEALDDRPGEVVKRLFMLGDPHTYSISR